MSQLLFCLHFYLHATMTADYWIGFIFSLLNSCEFSPQYFITNQFTTPPSIL